MQNMYLAVNLCVPIRKGVLAKDSLWKNVTWTFCFYTTWFATLGESLCIAAYPGLCKIIVDLPMITRCTNRNINHL